MGVSLNSAYYPLNTTEVFTLTPSSGVHVDATSLGFDLSPNPTNGIVAVHCENEVAQHITITNILGNSVMEVIEPAVSEFTLDLSKLPAGIYFIRLSSAGSGTTRMIVRN